MMMLCSKALRKGRMNERPMKNGRKHPLFVEHHAKRGNMLDRTNHWNPHLQTRHVNASAAGNLYEKAASRRGRHSRILTNYSDTAVPLRNANPSPKKKKRILGDNIDEDWNATVEQKSFQRLAKIRQSSRGMIKHAGIASNRLPRQFGGKVPAMPQLTRSKSPTVAPSAKPHKAPLRSQSAVLPTGLFGGTNDKVTARALEPAASSLTSSGVCEYSDPKRKAQLGFTIPRKTASKPLTTGGRSNPTISTSGRDVHEGVESPSHAVCASPKKKPRVYYDEV